MGSSRATVRPDGRPPVPSSPAFTLVEVMVGMTILLVIMVMVLGIISATSRAWTGSVARVESFQDARAAFDALTRLLSQATLNTYDKVTYGGSVPTGYARASDLQFLSGTAAVTGINGQLGHAVVFQAPLGYSADGSTAPLDGLLNVCGFYVDYQRNSLRPAFLDTLLGPNSNPYRFRLHQILQSTDACAIYQHPADTKWLAQAVADGSRQFAANVVALVLVPEDPSSPAAGSASSSATAATSISKSYDYDSRNTTLAAYQNQLPPVIEVFMAAIDEASAQKICTSGRAPELGQSSLFRSTASLEADIATLESILSAAAGNPAGNRVPLTHRFFRSKVVIQGAKWNG